MDEGYYLLLASSPSSYVTPTGFHFVLSKLPNITGSSVTNLRLFQLISQLVSSMVLAFGFWRLISTIWFRPTKIQVCASVVFTAVASFLLQSVFPPSLSYNGLTYFFIFSSFGLLFLSAGLDTRRARFSNCLAAGAGFLCGFELSIRFAVCILCAFLGVLWLALNAEKRRFMRYYVLGMICAPLLFMCLFQTPTQVQSQIAEIARYASMTTTHSPGSLLQSYVMNFVNTASTICQNFGFQLLLPILAAILNAFFLAKLNSAGRILLSLVFAMACLIPACFLPNLSEWVAFQSYVYVYTALFSCLSVFLVFGLARSGLNIKNVRINALAASSLILLLVLPFVCSTSTCNPILLQASTCLAPIFLAISALSLRVFPEFCASSHRFVLIGGLSALVAAMFVQGYMFHPYLLYSSLVDQKYECADLINMKGIKLSKESRDFLMSVSALLKKGGFRPGDPVISLYDTPGVIYAVGGTAPATGWLMSLAAFKGFRPMWFRDISATVSDRLFVVASWNVSSETKNCLKAAGIDFPNGFELIGTTQMEPYAYGLNDSGMDDDYLGGEVRVYKWEKPGE